MSLYDGATYPGILLRDGPTGQRAALAGGPDVWEVIAARHALKAETPELDGDELVTEMMASTGLSRHSVDVALRYYADHRTEIDGWIAADEAAAEQGELLWRAEQARRTVR
ncbi:hypothetical protein O7543_20360 [Solwaraspora sp. WMMA2080]|uniref:hypothetical protein n=1 Tax=unclassified Solwaraspora TaxID=2627926 RepID=UPI00248C0CDF|nr:MULTISPECIES: hypothetical protein [unclassified Solwaraspora]WBB96878.1 hypothetical protein O7553_27005 [Solwaraspora sp. WMMA2059]WBC19217.1 hypothetical protein O7543_20360 [Solwaraspora sp. WMMA2080]